MTNSATTYPFTTSVEVVFRDLDVMGHVNNAVYLTYLETARIKFLHHLLQPRSLGELPVILAEATVSYKSPAHYGERLTIGLGVARFGTKSFEVVGRIDAEDGRLVVLARTVLVAYDYASGTPIAVPEALKARMLEVQGAWQAPIPPASPAGAR